MRSRLHRIFLILAAIAYAILWIGSNVGPLADVLRDSLILEALVAALVFDLLWQLISREDASAQAASTDAFVRAELDRQGTMLSSLMPLLEVKTDGSSAMMPASSTAIAP